MKTNHHFKIRLLLKSSKSNPFATYDLLKENFTHANFSTYSSLRSATHLHSNLGIRSRTFCHKLRFCSACVTMTASYSPRKYFLIRQMEKLLARDVNSKQSFRRISAMALKTYNLFCKPCLTPCIRHVCAEV